MHPKKFGQLGCRAWISGLRRLARSTRACCRSSSGSCCSKAPAPSSSDASKALNKLLAARAGVATFRPPCNIIISSLDAPRGQPFDVDSWSTKLGLDANYSAEFKMWFSSILIRTEVFHPVGAPINHKAATGPGALCASFFCMMGLCLQGPESCL